MFHTSVGVQNWSATTVGCSGELHCFVGLFFKASKIWKAPTWTFRHMVISFYQCHESEWSRSNLACLKLVKAMGGKILNVVSDSSSKMMEVDCPWTSAEMWKLKQANALPKVKKRPLSFCPSYLSGSAVQYLATPLPSLLVLPSSPILYSQVVYKKKNLLCLVTMDRADRSAAFFPFCHSVALKDSLAEELLPGCFSDCRDEILAQTCICCSHPESHVVISEAFDW